MASSLKSERVFLTAALPLGGQGPLRVLLPQPSSRAAAPHSLPPHCQKYSRDSGHADLAQVEISSLQLVVRAANAEHLDFNLLFAPLYQACYPNKNVACFSIALRVLSCSDMSVGSEVPA